ncbi:hypothetical protein [Adonisia turfae]|nr:hypothetical protein [Adonisia turfae]
MKNNLFAVDSGIIVHQVNRKKVAIGLAKRLQDQWPALQDRYLDQFHGGRRINLGDVFSAKVTDSLFVVGIFGQNDYGPNQCHTSYAALVDGFRKIALKSSAEKIYIPHNLGCEDHEGGDWHVVRALIQQLLPKAIIMATEEPILVASSKNRLS